MKAPLEMKILCHVVEQMLVLGSDLVSQELARQSPEGVQGQETARQVHQLELFHVRVDEQLSGGQRRNTWSGRVGDVHSCKYRKDTGSDPVGNFQAVLRSVFGSFRAFEVVLSCESEANVVAIASRVFAVLGDSSTEAGDAATLHREVTLGTVPCTGQETRDTSATGATVS